MAMLGLRVFFCVLVVLYEIGANGDARPPPDGKVLAPMVVFEAEASGGGSKAGGLPHPSLSTFPPLLLSIPPISFPYQWEGRSDPVRGKFPGFPATNTTLLDPR